MTKDASTTLSETSTRASTATPLDMAVVIPAYRAANEIDAVLDGVFAAGFAADSVLVVDDGSPDDVGARAARRGVRVIRNDTPLRPARARNRGVEAVDAEIVVFIDADVIVHPGARDRLARWFTAEPPVAAVIGSYDDAPPAPAAVSRYRNLLHHFTHQQGGGDIKTFWTGLGAVRRAEYLALGGLDRDWENIEDVEFGLRLSRQGGRIVLDPTLQGAHLKAWTLRSMFLTDLKGRAVPWARLLRRGAIEMGALNTSAAHRYAALGVIGAIGGAILAPFLPGAWLLALGGATAFVCANWRFFAFLRRRGGLRFAIVAAFYHAVHYLAAILGYASVALFRSVRRSGAP